MSTMILAVAALLTAGGAASSENARIYGVTTALMSDSMQAPARLDGPDDSCNLTGCRTSGDRPTPSVASALTRVDGPDDSCNLTGCRADGPDDSCNLTGCRASADLPASSVATSTRVEASFARVLARLDGSDPSCSVTGECKPTFASRFAG